MIPYIGDFAEDATIYHYFNTFDSNDPSASVTITNLADTDIYVYKDGSVTDLVTDGASVVIDFDSRTGVHKLTIDTSVHADYATGSDYMVLIEGTTVDAGTITAAVFTFSIENRYNDVNVVQISGDATAADNAEAFFDGTGYAGTNNVIPTVTTVNGLAASSVTATAIASNAITSAKIAASAIGATQIATDAITAAKIAADAIGASELAAGAATEIGAAVWNAVQSSHVTGGSFGEIATEIASILEDTGTTLETHLTDIKGGTFSGATDSLEAIRDRGDAAWTTGAGGSDRLLMVDTTIATLASQTSFTLTAGSADDDAYNNCTIVVEDVSTSTQKAVGMVLDYTGATKTVTLKEALAFTIATTDKVYILAENALKSTVANRQLDVTATGAAGIDWGNVENPTTAVDLSGTDIQLVDTCTTNTDMRGTDSAATAANLATAQADLDIITGADGVNLLSATQASIDAIETDTADMQPKLGTPAADVSADIAAVKAETALIVADTNELQTDDVPGLIAALNDVAATDIVSSGAITTSGGAVSTVTDVTNQVTADATAISGSTEAADNLEASAETIVVGAATATTLTTTTMSTNLTEATDDHYNGRIIIWTSGVLQDQATDITDYTGATKLLTFTATTEAPGNGDTFIIV